MEINDIESKRIIASVLVGFMILSTVWYLHVEGSEPRTTELEILGNNGSTSVKAEIVTSSKEKLQGLKNRDYLCQNCGMLFVYDEDVTNGFWMENTTIPLSIAFIDSNRTIIDLQEMEPESLESHSPGKPYRYALEVNQGFYDKNGIKTGDGVEW